MIDPAFPPSGRGRPLSELIDQWVAASYEACDPSLSPWSGDPDGGELRLVMALRDVVSRCEAEVDDLTVFAESLLSAIRERLESEQ